MKKTNVWGWMTAIMLIAGLMLGNNTSALAGGGRGDDRGDKDKSEKRDGDKDSKGDKKKCDPRLPDGWHWEQRKCGKEGEHQSCDVCTPTSGSEERTDGYYSYIGLQNTIKVPQLNPSNILTGVKIWFRTRAYVSVGFENTDLGESHSYVTADLFVQIDPPASLPELSTVSKEYKVEYQQVLPAFDNQIDFGGLSGYTLDPLLNGSETTSPVTIVNIGVFSGTGTVDFPAQSHSESFLGGASNLQAKFNSLGGSDVYVEYTYLKPCPPTHHDGDKDEEEEDDDHGHRHDDDGEHHDGEEHDGDCHHVVIGPV